MAIASAAHRAAEYRLAAYAAAPGVAVRRGAGWFAVRTGADSNDMNGVVSDGRAGICAGLVTDLIEWFGTAPASWLTGRADAELTRLLLRAGARAERSGRWSGRRMPAQLASSVDAVEIVPVHSERDLDRWLDMATDAGWISGEHDRRARRELYQGVRADPALTHWLALDGDQPVGFATSYIDGEVLDPATSTSQKPGDVPGPVELWSQLEWWRQARAARR